MGVNDGRRIRSYNLKTGSPGRVIAIPGSETRSLYRVTRGGKVRRLCIPDRFHGLPNGVALHPFSGEIWFVTFNEVGSRWCPGGAAAPGLAVTAPGCTPITDQPSSLRP
jgi:hypothetical protein